MAQPVLEEIFKQSELHPSYVNRICGYFWTANEFPETASSVEKFWENFVKSRHAQFSEDVLRLSKNQKKVLRYLASYPTQNPSHHAVCEAIGISEASVRQAIQALLLKDYLLKDESGFIRLLDPALKDFLRSVS